MGETASHERLTSPCVTTGSINTVSFPPCCDTWHSRLFYPLRLSRTDFRHFLCSSIPGSRVSSFLGMASAAALVPGNGLLLWSSSGIPSECRW